MKLTELGFDFSNLTSCTLKRKNNILALVMGVLALCFLPMVIVFYILYTLGVPMEINNVMTYPGESGYETFFVIFLSVFGSLSVLFLIICLVGLRMPSKTHLIMDLDADFKTFYYIYDYFHKEEIYLTEKYAIVYKKSYNQVNVENNPAVIEKLYDKYIFWHDFDSFTDYKIVHRQNKTILKVKDRSGKWALRRTYSFSSEINIVPHKITETISSTTGGNSSVQSMKTYIFEDVNRKPYYEIDPEIKKALSQII